MLRLLKIDFKKFVNYRTFWVLMTLYSVLVVSIPTTVMEFLKWLKVKGANFNEFDPLRVPVLYFPDIWQNITYVYAFLKIVLAIVVIISVSNEFSYKTVRQNIIDGMSRIEFVGSKLSTILMLSLYSTLLVFLTGLITGLIYTPNYDFTDIFTGIEFVFAYFLDVLLYLLFAFLLTVLIKRSGLTIALLVIYLPLEYILTANLPNSIDFIGAYFPMHAMNNLIEVPFPKYIFQEIQDYVSMKSVLVALFYIVLFPLAIYKKLKQSDL
ncbi:MAG: hypothetical protein OEX22_09710 [Cyclobacteriaceae bacterium]|nr:hypothetical protein [Cyclobacteriaceae bacterium]